MRSDLLTQRWILLQLCVAVLAFLGLRSGLLQQAWTADTTWITSVILVFTFLSWVGIAWRTCQCSTYLNRGEYDIWLSRHGEAAKTKLASRVRPYQWMCSVLVLLGLLGTGYGMWTALSGIAHANIQDAHAVGVVIKSLVSGFSIAVWTTMTGIICSLLLAFNIQVLKGGYERLYVKYIGG